MRTRLSCWWTAVLRNAALTMNCCREADITRIFTRSSFWKKNSSGHEQYARRRGTWQSVRLALDAAAAGIHEAVSLECGHCAGHGCNRYAARTGATLVFSTRD